MALQAPPLESRGNFGLPLQPLELPARLGLFGIERQSRLVGLAGGSQQGRDARRA